jgi:F-type H+-transporting ATPase subunit epsilon
VSGTFTLRLVAPRLLREEQVALLRLADASGSFAVMRGHEDFLTACAPGIGSWLDGAGRRTYVAVDGGVLRVRDGAATLASREIFTHGDPEALAGILADTFRRRDASEQAFLAMLADMEQAFLRKSLEIARGR